MTETGFIKVQSGNLPKIDVYIMTTYFASNSDLTSVKLGGLKAARMFHEGPESPSGPTFIALQQKCLIDQ